MKSFGRMQSQVDNFRATGFLVKLTKAAEGTDAFKRANEKMSLGSSVPADFGDCSLLPFRALCCCSSQPLTGGFPGRNSGTSSAL